MAWVLISFCFLLPITKNSYMLLRNTSKDSGDLALCLFVINNCTLDLLPPVFEPFVFFFCISVYFIVLPLALIYCSVSASNPLSDKKLTINLSRKNLHLNWVF